MAKQITQNTFDEVVRENMDEFDMTAEEAMEDAVKQFKSQGVNVNNIVMDVKLYSGSGDADEITVHPVLAAVQALTKAIDSSSNDQQDVMRHLMAIQRECDLDLPHRCLAGGHGAYPALLKACEKYRREPDVLLTVIQTFCSLCNGQPDLLENKGTDLFIELLNDYKETVIIVEHVTRLIRYTCIKHEANRQRYVSKKIISVYFDLLSKYKAVRGAVRELTAALRVLTFDDDIRVPFGKAHDHAKMIVEEGDALKTILEICQDYTKDPVILGELFGTISLLVVRDEFCREVMDRGGLTLIFDALQNNIKQQGLVRQILGVLKTLAGNDDVKVAIVNKGGLVLILSAMTHHQAHPQISELGCAALSTVALRQPSHCTAIMDSYGHIVIVQAMKIHSNVEGVQTQACMAIRNLVARTREHCDAIVALDVEELLNLSIEKFPEHKDQAKAALRDLGCKVELKEIWKGQRGTMER